MMEKTTKYIEEFEDELTVLLSRYGAINCSMIEGDDTETGGPEWLLTIDYGLLKML